MFLLSTFNIFITVNTYYTLFSLASVLRLLTFKDSGLSIRTTAVSVYYSAYSIGRNTKH